MVVRNIMGGHVQSFAVYPDTRDFVTNGQMGSLKILQDARDMDAVSRWADNNPDAPLCCRRVLDGVGLEDIVYETSVTLDMFAEFIVRFGSRVWVEATVNEAYQNGDELKYLNDTQVECARIIAQAGAHPVLFNFSVGNPARINEAEIDGVVYNTQTSELRYIQSGAQAAIDYDGCIGYHAYSVPGEICDDWLDLRHVRMARELPVGSRFWLGEGFIDHGIIDGRLAGWRDDSFKLSAQDASALLRQQSVAINSDLRVVAFSPFGAGSYNDWYSFRYDDEDAIRKIFRELYDVAAPPSIGQGFQKFVPYLGQPLESEVYHFAGTDYETSMVVFEQGSAMWTKQTNECVATRYDGAVFHDRGNYGDGVSVWRLY